MVSPTFIPVGSARCARSAAGAAFPAEQGHGEWWPLCDQQSLGCGLFDTSHTSFFLPPPPSLESQASPKTRASQIISSQNSWPLLETFLWGIYLTLPCFFSLFTVHRLSLGFALLLSTSIYYLFGCPQWLPLCIQPLHSGSFSPVTCFPLSPSS